jgi:hypothetical protein
MKYVLVRTAYSLQKMESVLDRVQNEGDFFSLTGKLEAPWTGAVGHVCPPSQEEHRKKKKRKAEAGGIA